MAPIDAKRLAERLGEKDVFYLDAPISGGAAKAADGNLTVMDGVKWALDVRWEGHEVEASGHHSWPGGRAGFQRLVALLERAGSPSDSRWLASNGL